MKNRFAICETVGELKEFLNSIPDDTPVDSEQTKATIRRVIYCGSGEVERLEFALTEDDEG